MEVVWFAFGLVLLLSFSVLFGAPYVPSRRKDVERAFDELYQIGERDTLVDIGSGDGVVLRLAAARGARVIGYEIHPLLVLVSRILSRRDSRVIVHWKNFWTVDMPLETTVVYTFGESRDIKKMHRKVEEQATRLDRPLSFISYGFELPGMAPVRSIGAHHLYLIKPLHEGNHKYNK